MRHYRAPARLLDFTYSFPIAPFFAFQRAGKGNAAIWAENATWVQDEFQRQGEGLESCHSKAQPKCARAEGDEGR